MSRLIGQPPRKSESVQPVDNNYENPSSWADKPFHDVMKKKGKKKAPPVNVTPSDTNKETNLHTPPVAYANVIFRHHAKPPLEPISQNQIDAAPDIKDDIKNNEN